MRRYIHLNPFLTRVRNGRNGNAIPRHQSQWWRESAASFLTFLAIPESTLGTEICSIKSNVPAFLAVPTPKGVCARVPQERRTPTFGAAR